MQKKLRRIVFASAFAVCCSVLLPASAQQSGGQTGDPSVVIGPAAPSMPGSYFPTIPSNNTITVSGGTVDGHLFGGVTVTVGAESSNNEVYVSGGTIGSTASGTRGHVFGGWSDEGSVKDNYVEISGATTLVRGIVFGGWIDGGSVGYDGIENEVLIKNGTLRSNIYGAYSQGQNGTLFKNSITIDGGTVNGTASNRSIIAGAYSAILSNTVNENKVFINGGTLNYADIYGGRGQTTSHVTENLVEISGGTINNGMIYGGQLVNGGSGPPAGLVDKNTVIIIDGTVNATIYGGYAQSAAANHATLNTVDIRGGNITGNIYGGYSANGTATHNDVFISGTGTITGNVYGGARGGTGSTDVFTGNSLYKNSAVAVGTVQNFEFINFGYSGNAGIATL